MADCEYSRCFVLPIVYPISQMWRFDYEHNYIKIAQLCPPVTKMVIGSINLALLFRAHSFPWPAEFRAEPRNLGFSAEFEPRNLTAEFIIFPRNAAEFDVFHSNNYFFTENDLKVAPLQVSL